MKMIPSNLYETARQRRLRTFFRSFYRRNGRAFPWRDHGVQPFGVLVAEMLLRQTRAGPVVAIWNTLLEQYPTPSSLAEAEFESLWSLVRPLGFGRQRTDALRQMANYLVTHEQGRVPRTINRLSAIPHVGVYGANAVLCFAFGKRVPLVDVNVLRVLSRIYGRDLGQDNRRSPRAWEIAWSILPAYKFRQHNLGLLDFAALICTSRNPKHQTCPLKDICAFYQEQSIEPQ
jgi:A/G-specific adenine glycosylase